MSELTQQLLTKGILTTEIDESKAVETVNSTEPTRTLLLSNTERRPRGNPIFFMIFLIATTRAHFKLRFSTIQRVVDGVARRKQQHHGKVAANSADRTKYFVTLFLSYRRFFPRDYLCLFDSLALVEFLSFFRIFPTWTFGVSIEPFAAHCWVQDGDLLLNDTKERVGLYTGIMAV